MPSIPKLMVMERGVKAASKTTRRPDIGCRGVFPIQTPKRAEARAPERGFATRSALACGTASGPSPVQCIPTPLRTTNPRSTNTNNLGRHRQRTQVAMPIIPESQIARKLTVSQNMPRRCSSERRTSQRWRPGVELNTWPPSIRAGDNCCSSGRRVMVGRRVILVGTTLARPRPREVAVRQSDLTPSTRLRIETHKARRVQALNPSLIG